MRVRRRSTASTISGSGSRTIDEACRKVEAAGATHVMGEPTNNPDTFYEVKYRDPLGQIFDLTQNGWKGAVKDVVPAATPDKAGDKAEAAE